MNSTLLLKTAEQCIKKSIVLRKRVRLVIIHNKAYFNNKQISNQKFSNT